MHHQPGFISTLDAEQRARYYYWWQRYLMWRRAATITILTVFACGVAHSILLPMFLPGHPLLYRIAGAVGKPLFLVALGIAMMGSLMDCPRCGESFRGWFGRGYLRVECQNCGLTSAELASIAKPLR